jgi:hypothetical protein
MLADLGSTKRLEAAGPQLASESNLAVIAALRETMTSFAPISLDEMAGVSLQDRTDTKYLMGAHQSLELLASLTEDYRALDIDGVRANRYRTVYFDTDDFELYMRHHAGNEVRQKVRSREYLDSHVSYFEVKRKTNKDRTIKDRLQTGALVTELPAKGGTSDFLYSQFPLARPGLEARLTNEFHRVTLVNKQSEERVTVDFELRFSTDADATSLPGLAVVEVKQAGFDRWSPIVRAMRTAGVPPRGLSKYCIGVALLYPEIKHNNFKAKLLQIERLMKEDRHAW